MRRTVNAPRWARTATGARPRTEWHHHEAREWRFRQYRFDGFSTFGTSNPRASYPKASPAWTFTNLLGITPEQGILSLGKLRASFGETGREPPVYSTVLTFTTTTTYGSGSGDVINATQAGQAAVTNSFQLGNPNLKPERNKEYELGTDLGFFDQRADLSFTDFNKHSTNLILPVPINGAATGGTSQFVNGAAIERAGAEHASLHLAERRIRPRHGRDRVVDGRVRAGDDPRERLRALRASARPRRTWHRGVPRFPDRRRSQQRSEPPAGGNIAAALRWRPDALVGDPARRAQSLRRPLHPAVHWRRHSVRADLQIRARREHHGRHVRGPVHRRWTGRHPPLAGANGRGP